MTLPTRKQETHARIVTAAARAVRAKGYAGVGVADIMKDVGLTHGGFYAHFDSRAALLAEAADRAGAEGVEGLSRVAASAAPDKALMALIDAYLSRQHLEAPDSGCPIAATGTEVARQEPAVRKAATRRTKELVGLIERQMPDWGKAGNHEHALAILSCLVGSMVIARASDDERFSKAVRVASREFLRQALEDAQSGPRGGR
ncbi:MAG: TetR/AcrR family transcriptional regulator [Burkholderiaceae bacterium]|nr:TetR/AcrR family transcriptional regulator [Burkholderiaceae bacterium]